MKGITWKHQVYLPLVSVFSCRSKKSLSLFVTRAHPLQTRTGSTKHIRGSPTLVSQHDPQYICPQRRQWCCKNAKSVY